MPALEAETVAELLRNHDTRDATLSALEVHVTPINLAVSLAAAPVLNEIKASDTSEISQEEWDRVCLLLARLVADAGDNAATVYGTAYGGGRYAAVYQSDRTPLARALRKPAEELTVDDARSFANEYASKPPAYCRSWGKAFAAMGVTVLEGLALVMPADALFSRCT